MSTTFTEQDHAHMRRALKLAARGRGWVEPNPMVGCMIVRGGQAVGEGYHRRYGGPHAEVHALRQAGDQARGATAYVTLEPCCHHGKTPPCTRALIAAGVRRVIVAVTDPFPRVKGRGQRELRSAGISVETGLLKDEAKSLMAPYLKLQRTGKPWVILKWAQSIDGRIATRTGDSKWISGEQSRKEVHRLRGRVDAVIVGTRTVLVDNPELTCREGKPRRVATRIVLDSNLRIPLNARLVRSAAAAPVLVVTRRDAMGTPKAAKLERAGVELMAMKTPRSGFDVEALLAKLGSRGMTNILVEGGGHTLGLFVDRGAADEAIIYVSRRLIGGAAAPSALDGLGPRLMTDVRNPASVTRRRCGEDDVYELRFR